MSPSALGDRTSGHKKDQQMPSEARLMPCTHLQEEIPLHKAAEALLEWIN